MLSPAEDVNDEDVDIVRQLRHIERQLMDTPSIISPTDMQRAIERFLVQCEVAEP